MQDRHLKSALAPVKETVGASITHAEGLLGARYEVVDTSDAAVGKIAMIRHSIETRASVQVSNDQDDDQSARLTRSALIRGSWCYKGMLSCVAHILRRCIERWCNTRGLTFSQLIQVWTWRVYGS